MTMPSSPSGSAAFIYALLVLPIITSFSSVDSLSSSRSQLLSWPRRQNPETFAYFLSAVPSQDDADGTASHHNPPPSSSQPIPTSRRKILQQSAASIIAAGVTTLPLSNNNNANALPPIASFSNPFSQQGATQSNGGIYIPAKRCTAYLVDSTIPPSLIPYRAAREAAILKNLGMGSGTPKNPFVEDDINLNNFMNKAVFGALDAVKQVTSTTGDINASTLKSGTNYYQSFVFLGANFDDTYTASPDKVLGETNADAKLAVSLLSDICKPSVRNKADSTAIGLAYFPQSSQGVLNEYWMSTRNGSSSSSSLQQEEDEEAAERMVVEGLVASGVDEKLAKCHLPILRFAKKKRYPLLALAPNPSDLEIVNKGGLQSLDPARREVYVADAEGFIALTQEPKFKLYTEKSLLKDFNPTSSSSGKDEASIKAAQGNFFAERILVHEACATAIAKWASPRPESMVITIAPIPDVRFIGGINGRIPRICQYLNSESGVDEDAVTTILLNPNAKETLSESKFLRLEIGTAPNNWTYQTKIADYLWFSSMPKVNMIPRMMNEQ